MTFFSQDGALVVAGIVETCLSGSYFSICDTDWDDIEAQLVCNGLGYYAPFFRKFMLQDHLMSHSVISKCLYHYAISIIIYPQVVLLCEDLTLLPYQLLRM